VATIELARRISEISLNGMVCPYGMPLKKELLGIGI